jgi:predicted KAP-like P-loop ATPase
MVVGLKPLALQAELEGHLMQLREVTVRHHAVATIYFNGWQFEGYDDAKSALIHLILIEVGEHRKVAEKAKEHAKALLLEIDWLRLANIGYSVGAAINPRTSSRISRVAGKMPRNASEPPSTTILSSTRTLNSPYRPWTMSTSAPSSRRIWAATRTAWIPETQYEQ